MKEEVRQRRIHWKCRQDHGSPPAMMTFKPLLITCISRTGIRRGGSWITGWRRKRNSEVCPAGTVVHDIFMTYHRKQRHPGITRNWGSAPFRLCALLNGAPVRRPAWSLSQTRHPALYHGPAGLLGLKHQEPRRPRKAYPEPPPGAPQRYYQPETGLKPC